jgi:hypothetical protein
LNLVLDLAERPEIESPPEKLVGDELNALLEGLARIGLRIGPRERVLAAALVAELVARGHAKTFADLRPWLAPLLVHSPADRERFRQIFDLHSPVIKPKPPPDGASSANLWRWLGPTIAALIVFAVTIAGLIDLNSAAKTTEVATAPPPSNFDVLNRVAEAAKPYDDAPTLDELASELAKDSSIGWAATSYAVRLSELSGLPRSWPLALYGKDAKDGRVWAMDVEGFVALEIVEGCVGDYREQLPARGTRYGRARACASTRGPAARGCGRLRTASTDAPQDGFGSLVIRS